MNHLKGVREGGLQRSMLDQSTMTALHLIPLGSTAINNAINTIITDAITKSINTIKVLHLPEKENTSVQALDVVGAVHSLVAHDRNQSAPDYAWYVPCAGVLMPAQTGCSLLLVVTNCY